MQSQLKIRIKKMEYISFNVMHHFLIYPFFFSTLSPCTWSSHFSFLLFCFFFPLYCFFFFLYLSLALFLEKCSISLILLQQFITLRAISLLLDMTMILTVYSFSLSFFFFPLLADSLLSPGISFHFTPFPISLICFSGCVWLFVWYLANTLRIQISFTNKTENKHDKQQNLEDGKLKI